MPITVTFRSFDYKCDRVDQLMHAQLSDKDFTELWEVSQQVLLLSHSQATAERGFSVHKQTTAENLKKESLVARRLIHQAARKAGGPACVSLTKELLSYPSSARSKYEQHLGDLKRRKVAGNQALKRKAKDKEVDELKTKRSRLETDVASMEISAEKKALDAEKYGRLALLAESNAIRRSIKDKMTAVKELEMPSDKKLNSAATSDTTPFC